MCKVKNFVQHDQPVNVSVWNPHINLVKCGSLTCGLDMALTHHGVGTVPQRSPVVSGCSLVVDFLSPEGYNGEPP